MKTSTFLDQLTLCLQESRRPLGLFLGAGCGTAVMDEDDQPLLPDTRGLTETVNTLVQETDYQDSWHSVVNQVQDSLDSTRTPNIEDVLSHVRGLLRYAGDDVVRGLRAAELQELESYICRSISDTVSKELPASGTPYHRLATWIASADREKPVEIFTTNYDLFLEQSLEDARIPFFDGFVGSHRPFFDAYAVTKESLPPRWVRLWKVHGSINWATDVTNGKRRVWRSERRAGGKAVIHPSDMKYDESRKMPYLALMDRLQRFVSKPDCVLFVIGYSFGDDHLNDVIDQALQGSPSSAVFALMYDKISKYTEAEALALRRGNFSLLARDGAIVGTRRMQWATSEENSPSSNSRVGARWKDRDDGGSFEQLTLGDFEVFGRFLADVTGSRSNLSNDQ